MTQGEGNDAGVEHEERQRVDDDHAASVPIPAPASVPTPPLASVPTPPLASVSVPTPATGFVPAPAGSRATTGDDAVDDVLGQLDAVADEPLDSQIRAGEQVHRVLQGRLADLGKE